jgi:four helix bundle protein
MTTKAGTKSFRELVVWQKAHALVLEVYRASQEFPKAEQFGLTSQLRRAAASVPTHIVEGYRRRSRPDKARFFNIAEASLDEAHYFMILAQDLGYRINFDFEPRFREVSRLLRAYSDRIRASESSNS